MSAVVVAALGLSCGAYPASAQPSNDCASHMTWQCSAYDPANEAWKTGTSHVVDGIQLIPNAPGWDPNAPGLRAIYDQIRATWAEGWKS
jgi:hypothetical protein